MKSISKTKKGKTFTNHGGVKFPKVGGDKSLVNRADANLKKF